MEVLLHCLVFLWISNFSNLVFNKHSNKNFPSISMGVTFSNLDLAPSFFFTLTYSIAWGHLALVERVSHETLELL